MTTLPLPTLFQLSSTTTLPNSASTCTTQTSRTESTMPANIQIAKSLSIASSAGPCTGMSVNSMKCMASQKLVSNNQSQCAQYCGSPPPNAATQLYGCAPYMVAIPLPKNQNGNVTTSIETPPVMGNNPCDTAHKNPCTVFEDYGGPVLQGSTGLYSDGPITFNAVQNGSMFVERGLMLFTDFGCNPSKLPWLEIVPMGNNADGTPGNPVTLDFWALGPGKNNFQVRGSVARLSVYNTSGPGSAVHYTTLNPPPKVNGISFVPLVTSDMPNNSTVTYTNNGHTTIYPSPNSPSITNIPFNQPGAYDSKGNWEGWINDGGSHTLNNGGIVSMYIPPHLECMLLPQNTIPVGWGSSAISTNPGDTYNVYNTDRTWTSWLQMENAQIPGTGFAYTLSGQNTLTPIPLSGPGNKTVALPNTTSAGTSMNSAITADQDGALRTIAQLSLPIATSPTNGASANSGTLVNVYLFDILAVQVRDRGVNGLGNYVNATNTKGQGFNPSLFMVNGGQSVTVNGTTITTPKPKSGKSYMVFNDSYKYCMYAACMNNKGALPFYGSPDMAWKRNMAFFNDNRTNTFTCPADDVMGDYCVQMMNAFLGSSSASSYDVGCGCYTMLGTSTKMPIPPSVKSTPQNSSTPVPVINQVNQWLSDPSKMSAACPYLSVASCGASTTAYVPSYAQIQCSVNQQVCSSINNFSSDGTVTLDGFTTSNNCTQQTGAGTGTGVQTISTGGPTPTGSGGGGNTTGKPTGDGGKTSSSSSSTSWWSKLTTTEKIAMSAAVVVAILVTLFILILILRSVTSSSSSETITDS